MKRFLVVLLIITSSIVTSAQKTWDGDGDGFSWNDAANWQPNGVPIATDNVLLDNSLEAASYTVVLPAGGITTSVNTLTITPSGGFSIELTIPASNTANPGLNITGPGDALVLNDRAVLMNSTGVGPGGVGLTIANTFRINNGGRYVHNNIRGHTSILDQLSSAIGTEAGIFEFDFPGTGSSTLSITGRIFGTLVFSAIASGSGRVYTGSGASDLTIRGDLIINTDATFTSTMTANINIGGNLTIAGIFENEPVSPGITGRSILFNGTSDQVVSGAGSFTFSADFRNIEVSAASTVVLQRPIDLSNPGNTFIVNPSGVLQMGTSVISGSGSFQLATGGWIGIGSPGGIASAPALSGNVQTATRTFPPAAVYEYNGTSGVTQITGTGLPISITGILMINTLAGIGTSGVTLTQPTSVTVEFALIEGKLTTTSTNLLTIGNNAITTTAFLDNAFVSGPLSKLGNALYRFPVGKGSTIHPCELEMSGGPPTNRYTAEYFQAGPTCTPGNVQSGIHHQSGLEYWSIESIGFGQSNKVTLYASTLSQATNRERLVITRCTGGNWENLGNDDLSGTGAVGDVRSSTTLNGPFANIFTLASLDASPVNPLPINLLTFDATKLTGTTSLVTWQLSACCSPLAKFEVQRADASKNFVTVGEVGGSATHTSYNYTDPAMKTGINYYRLKMIDADGKISYTRIVAVMNGVKGLLLTSLIPTVVTHNASLTIASSHQQKIQLVITDMQGWVVKSQTVSVMNGNSSIQLSLTGIPAGIYHLTGLSAEGKTNTIRFLR